uniref:Secreted protein n=1 Tax=Ixodes scapularis TaxID=6945 RepID=A0A4D5S4J8_IXOSC
MPVLALLSTFTALSKSQPDFFSQPCGEGGPITNTHCKTQLSFCTWMYQNFFLCFSGLGRQFFHFLRLFIMLRVESRAIEDRHTNGGRDLSESENIFFFIVLCFAAMLLFGLPFCAIQSGTTSSGVQLLSLKNTRSTNMWMVSFPCCSHTPCSAVDMSFFFFLLASIVDEHDL